MLKLKLQPTGRRNQRQFRIVVAEERSKLEGRYIDAVGEYNPSTDPATIKIDMEKYNSWIQKGARPTRTVRLLASNL